MSRDERRTVGIAALLVLLLALPVAAAAQTFTDPRQATGDQYGTPTPTSTPAANVTPTPTPAVPRTQPPGTDAGGDDDGREASGGRREVRRGSGGNEAGEGGRGVARREQGGDVAASLPFTGLNVSTLIVVGLLLGATGLGLRAVQNRRGKRA